MKEFEENAVQTAEEPEKKAPKKKSDRRSNWKSNRKLRLGTTATIFTVVIVAAVMVFNIIVGILYDRFPLSLDLTADNTFTLSEESREVARNVTNDLEILVFYQESSFASPTETSDDVNTVLRQFYIFTQDYQTLSNGHITVKYLDMEADPTLVTKYKNYGVQSGDILFRTVVNGTEQYRVINVGDLFLQEYDSSYNYAFSSLVEQKLASTVNAICGGKTVTLTFLTGHGENEGVISAMQSLYKLNGYLVNTLNLSTATEINETTEAMIIVGPTSDYTIDEITRLRSWLNNDGKLNRDLFVLCNYTASCPNLYNFLESDYGITVTDNLIVETDTDNYLMMYSNGELLPITSVQNTDLTAEIADKSVMMPYTLQLKTSFGSDTDAESVTNYPLIQFTESAKLIPQASLTEDSEAEQLTADEYPVIGMAYAKELRQTSSHAGETNVIVSGSFMYPALTELAQYVNEAFTLEPIRSICSLGDTVVISATDLSTPTLSYSVADAQIIEIVMIAFPLILVIVSLVVFLKRRHL